MKGIVLENVEKEELIDAIRETLADHVVILLSSDEAASLAGVSVQTVSAWKKQGRLRDWSRHNEHRKFSVREVLEIRRAKDVH